MQIRKQNSLKKTMKKRKAKSPLVDVKDTDEAESKDQEEKHLNIDVGIDLEVENWAIGSKNDASSRENDKSKDHTEDY